MKLPLIASLLLGLAGASSLRAADEPAPTLLPVDPGSPAAPPPAVPAKPKVAIMEATVTLNGENRPDLGRSFSDSLASGILKTGAVDIIDTETFAKAENGQKQSPVQVGSASGAAFVYVPTIVGQDEFYKLTLKKLAIPSGRIEEITEESASGSSARLFELMDRVVLLMSPPPPRPVRAPVYSTIRSWMSGPADVSKALADAPAALPRGHAAKKSATEPAHAEVRAARDLPKAVPAPKPAESGADEGSGTEIEEIGCVTAVNFDWSFAVIRPRPGQKMKSGDVILIAVNGWTRPTLQATITRKQGDQYVAEFEPVSGTLSLPGQALVYAWQPGAAPPPPAPIPPPPSNSF